MQIGIIGAGHIGSALARNLAGLGHTVVIANSRGPDTLADVVRDTGARAVTVEEAVKGKDLIILTIPLKAVPNLPAGLFASISADVPVIDTCNYYPRERDGRIDAIENGLVESAWVAQQIGHPTIKVFNNIYSKRLAEDGRPAGSADRIALPVSGDDAAQKQKVMALVDELGFEPIDVGGIADSWRYQPATPAYGTNTDADTVRQQLAAASPERTTKFSA